MSSGIKLEPQDYEERWYQNDPRMQRFVRQGLNAEPPTALYRVKTSGAQIGLLFVYATEMVYRPCDYDYSLEWLSEHPSYLRRGIWIGAKVTDVLSFLMDSIRELL